jgi:hypothetical protein
VKSVTGISIFKAFIDKLYLLYNGSPKSARGLKVWAKLLDIELFKISLLLSTRWVAWVFRLVSIVLNNCEALVNHFQEAKNDSTRGKQHRYAHLKDNRENDNYKFYIKLRFIVQELSGLSLDLQECNMDL